MYYKDFGQYFEVPGYLLNLYSNIAITKISLYFLLKLCKALHGD